MEPIPRLPLNAGWFGRIEAEIKFKGEDQMTNEELTKIAWTREITDERVRVAAAYWLDCSPHERTEADGIILSRYARTAMEKIESQKEEIEKLKHRDRVVSLASETLGRYVNEGKEEIKVLKRRLERLAETSVDISEHESLKAITELAIKSLQLISQGENMWQNAVQTLTEINYIRNR